MLLERSQRYFSLHFRSMAAHIMVQVLITCATGVMSTAVNNRIVRSGYLWPRRPLHSAYDNTVAPTKWESRFGKDVRCCELVQMMKRGANSTFWADKAGRRIFPFLRKTTRRKAPSSIQKVTGRNKHIFWKPDVVHKVLACLSYIQLDCFCFHFSAITFNVKLRKPRSLTNSSREVTACPCSFAIIWYLARWCSKVGVQEVLQPRSGINMSALVPSATAFSRHSLISQFLGHIFKIIVAG